jgi:hypothetical protein
MWRNFCARYHVAANDARQCWRGAPIAKRNARLYCCTRFIGSINTYFSLYFLSLSLSLSLSLISNMTPEERKTAEAERAQRRSAAKSGDDSTPRRKLLPDDSDDELGIGMLLLLLFFTLFSLC